MNEKLKKEIEKLIDKKIKEVKFIQLQSNGGFFFYPHDIHKVIKAILGHLGVELKWVCQKDGKYILVKKKKK